MIEPDKIASPNAEGYEPPFSRARPHNRAPADPVNLQIMKLEMENSRLQRLVAELLLKNQQLRKEREQD